MTNCPRIGHFDSNIFSSHGCIVLEASQNETLFLIWDMENPVKGLRQEFVLFQFAV
jgi:hypothetical protein